ncbi:MAG TPA: ATP-binding protein [Xanthomonadales bacterium]|nr:ATP-binding protein [Xanthomonadales bacterium]
MATPPLPLHDIHALALENERLRADVARLAQGERLQHALFAIADLAGSDLDMPDMLRRIHAIVGSLMYAENFYIVQVVPGRAAIRMLYYADSVDVEHHDPHVELPLADFEGSLTWHLLHAGRPLRGSPEELQAQVPYPLRTIGPDSPDWLGVPMLQGDFVRGAVVVQSYVHRERYTANDEALLAFVASHILTALDRKQSVAALEASVAQRTAELAQANDELRHEVRVREHAERLQSALYRLAELALGADTLEAFLAEAHAIVRSLVDARNFYVALLDDAGAMLTFPYAVDERNAPIEPRAPSRGATEYVLRTAQPLLADHTTLEAMARAGELVEFGERAQCWLGVPLLRGGRAVGVLAVQSYSRDVRYGEPERELLSFVARQLAVGLERRAAQAALRAANAELERRVSDRTAELTERNAQLEAANRALASTQGQLLQSEKMASVGQLAAGVAHEINNPIGFVRSNLGSLRQYLKDLLLLLDAYERVEGQLPSNNPELAQLRALKDTIELDYLRADVPNLVSESIDGVTRVEKIVRDLKGFSHVGDAEWKPFDLHEGLESTLNVVAHELKYKAELVREYGDVPAVECMPFQVNQVFLNLLVNATQAIRQRGRITLRTGSDGEFAWVAVADTGCGIEPAALPRVFEPFYTTKPVGEGTGLGLSVSWDIVHRHGGTIEVESEPGRGTTFTVRLPIQRRGD